MPTRTWQKIAVAAALTMATAASNAQDAATTTVPTGTLTIGWEWDPRTMDPQAHRERFTQIISHTMRDKLAYQPAPGLKAGLLLAESVTQVDDLNYDVKIREGVKFHDGTEMTSDDIVYTFERLWDPANKSPRAAMGKMASIEGIKALDRYTVRWTTKVPFGPVEDAIEGFHLGGQEILQKAYYEKLSLDEARTAPVMGAGPFKFVEWVPDQRIVMDAFGDYWQGAPGVERIIWRTIPEEATRVAELLAGSVDMVYPVSPDFVGQLKAAGMKMEIVPGTTIRALNMNVREGSPFHDVEVRKAMNMAFDKASITENLYQGLAIPFEQVAGAGQEGFIEGYDPFPYDADKARAILSKVTQPIELLAQGQWELPAEVIAETLRSYGMNVKTVILENAAYAKATEEGSFDLAFDGAGYGTGRFSGGYYNDHFGCARLEANRIRTGFCDPELDAKMDAALAATDPAARQALIEEVVKLLSETHVPWVPMYGVAGVWAMQPYVEGFVGSAAGQMFDLQNVTLNK